MVFVVFYDKKEGNELQISDTKSFAANKDANSSCHIVRLIDLIPATFYRLKFQYRYDSSQTFSELTNFISFKTENMCIKIFI